MSKLDHTAVINTMDNSKGSQDTDDKNCNLTLEQQLLAIFNSHKPQFNKEPIKVKASICEDKKAKEVKYSDEGNILGDDVLLTKRPRTAHSSANVRNFFT